MALLSLLRPHGGFLHGNNQLSDSELVYNFFHSLTSLSTFSKFSLVKFLTLMTNKRFVCLVCLVLSRLFIAALWSRAVKGLTSWILLVMYIVFFFYFPMWYPGAGVVFNCIVS